MLIEKIICDYAIWMGRNRIKLQKSIISYVHKPLYHLLQFETVTVWNKCAFMYQNQVWNVNTRCSYGNKGSMFAEVLLKHNAFAGLRFSAIKLPVLYYTVTANEIFYLVMCQLLHNRLSVNIGFRLLMWNAMIEFKLRSC